MLSKILSRKTCAECKWCCIFDRNDHWETPLVIADNAETLRCRFPDATLTFLKTDYKLDLSKHFTTDNPDEYAYCPYLNCQTGCTLTEDEKPFDCKIWPLRVMRQNEQILLTLTPTCPACNAIPLETMKQFVESELAESIENYAKQHPDMVLPYREGYPILCSLHIM